MSAVSKNPFDALGDDDEEAEASVKKDVREVKKPAAPAKLGTAAPAPQVAKEAPKQQNSQGENNRRPPRREFERHSGTGRGRRADGAEDKKGGSGKYNWGTKDSGTTPNDEAGEANESRELTEEEKAAVEAAAEAKRKEESQITLDEFLKLKAQQAKDEQEKLEVRKAEAIDMKGLKVKSEESEEVWTIGDESGKAGNGKAKKSGRKATQFMDASFVMPPTETGPSGGRGRGRGRGGGGGDFRRSAGGGAPAPTPAVSLDSAAFPSLG